jgi:hypothetical protein
VCGGGVGATQGEKGQGHWHHGTKEGAKVSDSEKCT